MSLSTSLMLLLRDNMRFVNLVGFTALMLEATLAVPQIRSNYRRKSVKGMSDGMVLAFIVGDVGKTIFFYVTQEPLPFIVSGAMMVAFDLVLTAQIVYYRLS